MPLKAVILDVDGTLAETADVKRAAFNQAFAEFGLDWVWGRAIFAQIIANALPGSEVEFFTLLRHPEEFQKMERTGKIRYICARQLAIYRNLLEAGAAPLRPGISRLLSELVTSRVKLAICSTSSREHFEILLYNRFGLEFIDGLKYVTSAEELDRPTALESYRLLVKKLGLAPSEIIAVDDSAKGVAAAAGLGVSVIAVPGFYTRNDKFPGAMLVLSDLGHPAAPFAVMDGSLRGVSHITLNDLRMLHSRARVQTANAA